MTTLYRPLPAWCAGEDWCPVTCAAAVIGKKWHPVIVHRLLERGPMRFGELQDSIDGVSGKVLSESLDDLAAKRLVERRVLDEKPVGVEYSLTAYGRGLEPVVREMRAWGETYLVETADRGESII